MRELKFNRKEVFLISVILFMILAWLIGNLGGAYFGMEEEKPDRHLQKPDDENVKGSAFNIPPKLARLVFFGLILAGVISIFIAPKKDVKDSFINIKNLFRLLFIALPFIIFELYQLRSAFGTWLGIPFEFKIEIPYMLEGLFQGGSTHPFSTVGASAAVLVFLTSILIVVFFFIRHKKISERSSKTDEDITTTAERAITELHKGENIKDVIIRNYQKMLIILEEEGVKQEISFTPRELEKTALNKLPLKKQTIDDMTRLFEEAKYSDHPLKEEKRDLAIRNFREIKDELEGEENA